MTFKSGGQDSLNSDNGCQKVVPHKVTALITLYNVCAVPWEVFSTVGDILSTRAVFSTVRVYHDARGGCSVS